MRALQFILLCGAAPLAGAQNDSCPVTTTPVFNYGVNSGGCFKCHTAGSESTWATGEELEALCKRTCLADAKCMAYETSRPDMVPIFERFSMISPETINCCIEHVAPDAFQVPSSTYLTTPYCKKEASCWTTSELSCVSGGAEAQPAECVRVDHEIVRPDSSAEDIQEVKDWAANDCNKWKALDMLDDSCTLLPEYGACERPLDGFEPA